MTVGPGQAVGNQTTKSGAAPRVSKDDGASATGPRSLATLLAAARSDDDLRALIATLRAAGFPANVIRAMVNEALKARFAAGEPKMPFWQRINAPAELVAAGQALERERRELFEELLGADAAPSATMAAAQRAARYGELSDEKLNAVVRIERDYNEVRISALSTGGPNVISRIGDSMDRERLLEAELMADLAGVLGPEELEAYALRNSQSARKVMTQSAGIAVTAEEFAALYRLQKEFDSAHPMVVGGDDMAAILKRVEGQQALNEKIRPLLTEDRFYRYLESADSSYARLARFTAQQPGVSPATSYKVYQLQQELERALRPKVQNGAPAGRPVMPDIKPYSDRLEALLGPSVAAAYKRTPFGRLFALPPQPK